MRSLKSFLGGLVAILAVALAPSARAQVPSPVDGHWEMKAVADSTSLKAGAQSFDDHLVIELGIATTEMFSKYGFTPASASILSLVPLLKFDVTYAANKFGTLNCVGTYNGVNKINGTLTWNRANGKVWKYTYEMTRVAAPTSVAAD